MPSINDSKCVLIIGATAGIGRALALSIHSLPSKPTVIIGGRRKERLDELAQAHKSLGRLETVQVNIDSDRSTLKKFAEEVISKHPDLDTIILSAGIQHIFNFAKPEEVDLDKFSSELNTNYISIITLITFFLPHLLKLGSQGQQCVISPISSGLAIVPGPFVPGYSATKAALHNFSMSLSIQLEGTNVHVMEILPPLVESELHDHQGTTERLSKFWMPLAEFTDLTMKGLKDGDVQIAIGHTGEQYKQFEEGKLEIAAKMFASRPW